MPHRWRRILTCPTGQHRGERHLAPRTVARTFQQVPDVAQRTWNPAAHSCPQSTARARHPSARRPLRTARRGGDRRPNSGSISPRRSTIQPAWCCRCPTGTTCSTRWGDGGSARAPGGGSPGIAMRGPARTVVVRPAKSSSSSRRSRGSSTVFRRCRVNRHQLGLPVERSWSRRQVAPGERGGPRRACRTGRHRSRWGRRGSADH